jgi:hypothetical protein
MCLASVLFSTEPVNILYFKSTKAANESVRFELNGLIIERNNVNSNLLSFKKNENI